MDSVVSLNPFRPSDAVGEWPLFAAQDLGAVLGQASKARRSWARSAATERSRALSAAASDLEAARDRITELVVREVGKPVGEAHGEVQRGIDILRYHAATILTPHGDVLPGSTPTGLEYTFRRPLGTVAVVTPWNFPVAIPLWKTVPALAWGNAVVLKPSSAALGVAMALTEILAPHLPEGLLACLPGEGEVVQSLLSSPEIHGASFTGSTRVGNLLIRQAADRALPLQAEMGGSNPSVVLADADVDRAAAVIASAAMGFAGQKCTATSRIIVEAPIYKEFKEALVARVLAMAVGDPALPDTVSGPVISREALNSALEAVAGSDGDVLTGGRETGEGYCLAPTLVEVHEHDALLADEVFAPVAALVEAKDFQDALRLVNDTPFGLSAGLFTNDLARTLDFLVNAEAGMLRINAPTTGVDYWAPFGGLKSSAFGTREQGMSARDFYTHQCTAFIDQ